MVFSSRVVVSRVLTELVSKMKDMQMDKTELGCLRAIVLFNPGNYNQRGIQQRRLIPERKRRVVTLVHLSSPDIHPIGQSVFFPPTSFQLSKSPATMCYKLITITLQEDMPCLT
jgi:hypothetical protein